MLTSTTYEVTKSKYFFKIPFSPHITGISVNVFAFAAFWGRLGIPSERVAYFDTKVSFISNRAIFKNGPKINKKKFVTFLRGVGTRRNNFIFRVSEDVMRDLINGGIVQYFLAFIEDVVCRKVPTDEVGNKQFDVEDLKFVFMIYLVACGISTLAFLFELLIFYTKKFAETFLLITAIRNQRKFF